MTEIVTHSAAETVELGKRIGMRLRRGDVVAFRGGLGAGKTTLTRGIAVGMGLGDEVTSPTFALVNVYENGDRTPLCHFDMYRIGSEEELDAIGFYDYLEQGAALAVEWSENIAGALPKGTVYISLERLSDEERLIRLSAEGDDRFDDIGDRHLG